MLQSKSFGYLGVALRAMIAFTVLLGVAYPFAIMGAARIFPDQATGSLVTDSEGDVRGSTLIGQSFSDAQGKPIAKYFQPRPSAAGNGYDAMSSGGSNLGPNSPVLLKQIAQRRAEVATFNAVPESRVPADAVTASGSGLDPLISSQYASIQVERVAKARGLTTAEIEAEVLKAEVDAVPWRSEEPLVNVVLLNLHLDELNAASAN